MEQCFKGGGGKGRGASPFSLPQTEVHNPNLMEINIGLYKHHLIILNVYKCASSSHLQVVLLPLQSLQAAAFWLTLDGHICLLLEDVQAELLAAAQALLHTHSQPGMLV